MNNDLLIEAAFSKMKNNLKIYVQICSKRPSTACNQGGKKHQEIPRSILIGGKQGKGGDKGKREGKRREGRGSGELELAREEHRKVNIWEHFLCPFSEITVTWTLQPFPANGGE